MDMEFCYDSLHIDPQIFAIFSAGIGSPPPQWGGVWGVPMCELIINPYAPSRNVGSRDENLDENFD